MKDYYLRTFKINAILLLLILGILSQNMLNASYRGKFDKLSIDHGLSQNSVRSILQDSKGFIWLGTYDGLNRYDGKSVKIYQPNASDSNSISNRIIIGLSLDKQENIWIGTDGGGVNWFDVKQEKFNRLAKVFPQKPELNSLQIRSILVARNGDIWFGTMYNGLYCYSPDKQTIVNYKSDPKNSSSISDNSVWELFEDKKGDLWCGTYTGRLNRFDPAAKKFEQFSFKQTINDKSKHHPVFSITEDHSGILWIGTFGDGLIRFNPETKNHAKYRHNSSHQQTITSNKIWDIISENGKTLWIATNNGLNQFDINRNEFKHYIHNPIDHNSISQNQTRSLLLDQSGLIWIGTYNRGVNILNRGQKEIYHYSQHPSLPNSLLSNNVRSFYESVDGNIWTATMSGGLQKFNPNTGNFISFTKNNLIPVTNIRAVYEDKFGILWIGTDQNGLLRFNPRTSEKQYYRTTSSIPLSNNQIRTIKEDSRGRLWIGTFGGGLTQLIFDRPALPDRKIIKSELFEFTENDPGSINNNYIWQIFEDHEQNIWIATSGGIAIYREKREDFFQIKKKSADSLGIKSNKIRCIFQDQNNQIWIGSYGGGLFKLISPFKIQSEQNKFSPLNFQFYNYTEKHGLPSNVIYGIVEDSQYNLWFSTNRGLSRFNADSNNFRNFDISDGLQSNEFNSGAYLRDSKGRLYFGGVNGFNLINPSRLNENPFIPPVVIHKFEVNAQEILPGRKYNNRKILDNSIQFTSKIELDHTARIISFEFSALSFNNSAKNEYAFILEGLEKNWHHATDRNYATYINLPSGQYEFKVKASNNDKRWNHKPASILLIIHPPFYRTSWFISALILLFILLIVSFHRWRVGTYQKHNKELSGINRKLNLEIKTRETAEIRLKESEEKYRRIFENIQDIYYEATMDGILLEISPSITFHSQYKREDIIGRSIYEFYDDPLERQVFLKEIKQDFRVTDFHLVLKDKDGTPLHCMLNSIILSNEAGEPQKMVGSIREITAYKKLEAQLLQSQKMEAVGRLAGGIAHDFNNLLTVIMGYSNLMLLNTPKNDGNYKNLQQIFEAGERAQKLTSQLLAFSRKQLLQVSDLNITDLVNKLREIIKRLIRENIELHFSLARDLESIKADATQIEQVLLNLVVNASDAIQEKGKIHIITENCLVDESHKYFNTFKMSGPYITLRVKDSGIGMSDEIMNLIFEPFFTTKEVGKGTGLGLATVFGIVKQSDGYIFVESSPGNGTEFLIYFPSGKLSGKSEEPDPKTTEQKKRKRRIKQILIVEEEEQIRNLIAASVKKGRHKINISASAELALEFCDKTGGDIDLLVANLFTAGMSGKELTKKIRKIFPQIKTIFMTDYGDLSILPEADSYKDFTVIQKPFSPLHFLEIIEKELDKA